VINVGHQAVDAVLDLSSENWTWDERSLYFHAVWNPNFSIETQTGSAPNWLNAFDVNYATIKGTGKWVGDNLTIFNGAPAWWGEGDEKIWVDGEAFPSHIGTGTEDYYSYAWGNPNPFSHPFLAQPYGAGANQTDMAVNVRWRSLDAIPFDKSIQFDMELWHWSKTKMNFEPTSFFYARPHAVVNVNPLPGMASMRVPKVKEDVAPPYLVSGAIEAESMKREATGGEIQLQSHSNLKWSGDRQVWWLDPAVGDELTLTFDSLQIGEFNVFANLTIAEDYGIASFSLNGVELAQNVDLYSSTLSAKEFRLGRATLKAQGNVFKIKMAGANEYAVKRRMVGIDYLRFQQ